jgi:hypothetical protein
MKVKKIRAGATRDLDKINKARVSAGLKPLVVKVRRCLICKCLFESLEQRTCGCKNLNSSLFFQ